MILVTGAAGLNGSAIVREFSRRGVPVRALVRNWSKAAVLAQLPHIDLVEGDMARADTLGSTLEGISRVLMISSSNPQMLETQCRFVDACNAAGVGRVVKFSGKESGIGFEAKSFRFTRMHEEIERYIEGSSVAWTHLRPSQFMQVYLREGPTIARQGLLCLPLENVKLSPVDVEDIAKIAFALLIGAGHQSLAFEITGPQALSMADVAAIIADAIGKPVRYENISPEDRRQAMEAARVPSFMIDALDEQAAERRRHPESRVRSQHTRTVRGEADDIRRICKASRSDLFRYQGRLTLPAMLLADHREAFPLPALDLDPLLAAPGTVRSVRVLAHDPLKTQVGCLGIQGCAIVEMLTVEHARRCCAAGQPLPRSGCAACGFVMSDNAWR